MYGVLLHTPYTLPHTRIRYAVWTEFLASFYFSDMLRFSLPLIRFRFFSFWILRLYYCHWRVAFVYINDFGMVRWLACMFQNHFSIYKMFILSINTFIWRHCAYDAFKNNSSSSSNNSDNGDQQTHTHAHSIERHRRMGGKKEIIWFLLAFWSLKGFYFYIYFISVCVFVYVQCA